MMRKIAVLPLALALVCLGAPGVLAKPSSAKPNPDSGPGCGLGKMAWAKYKQQKNIAPQILMGITNQWLPPFNQSLGISYETSGCTNDEKLWAEEKATMFAEINFENLSQDMAQGQGEHLASLATLLGVPAEQQAEFFAMTQERYTSLIQSGEASPVALVKALHEVMAAHPVLAKVSTTR
ncbi:MAG: DUF3015 domain-containing protein [Thermodesulfobacteriota bacterium]